MRRSLLGRVLTSSLAIAALASPFAPPAGFGLTAFVTLDVPVNEGDTILLTLRLDIGESQSPCEFGHVTINGQALRRDSSDKGQGNIAMSSDHAITAAWSFSCHQRGSDDDEIPKTMMKMQIRRLDGLEILPFNFSAMFSQTAPLRIWAVDGVADISRIHQTGSIENRTEGPATMAELHAQMQKLGIMRLRSRKLRTSILKEEKSVAKLLSDKGWSLADDTEVGDNPARNKDKLLANDGPRAHVSQQNVRIERWERLDQVPLSNGIAAVANSTDKPDHHCAPAPSQLHLVLALGTAVLSIISCSLLYLCRRAARTLPEHWEKHNA